MQALAAWRHAFRSVCTVWVAAMSWGCASLLLYCVAGPAGAAESVDRLGEATLIGLNGRARHLAEYRGKPLIINVWASWCGPCKQETASFERLAWLDVARGFNIIGISTDDYPDKAIAWLNDSHATIDQFIDSRLEMEHMLGASKLPLTVLVDGGGRILARIYGSRQWDGPEAVALIERTFGMVQTEPQ